MPGPVVHRIVSEQLTDAVADRSDCDPDGRIEDLLRTYPRHLAFGAQGLDPFFFNVHDWPVIPRHVVQAYLEVSNFIAEFKARLRQLFPFLAAIDEFIDDVATDRILAFVTELVGDRDIDVTLLRVVGDEGVTSLEDAQSRLTTEGITVRTVVAEDTAPLNALLAAVPDHDAIVMGEQAPSLASFLLGEVTERIAAESVGPVLVVRRPQEAEE